MVRSPRNDEPGAWHHVWNRGIAKRVVFENRRCMRFFLSLLARAVRAGRIEVHGFTVLGTHFHLLVRSPAGTLSEVMRDVLNTYVRWYNRRMRRDGPLFRGRFRSKKVESIEYRRILVGYIDFNAVEAGLARSAEEYEYSSARCFTSGRSPRWLSRSWIESEACDLTSRKIFDAEAYRIAYHSGTNPRTLDLVARRLDHAGCDPDPLDDLVAAAPATVLAWMRRKAALADQVPLGMPCASLLDIEEVIASSRADSAPLVLGERRRVSGWDILRIGLSRDLSAASWEEIAKRCGLAISTAYRRYRSHGEELERDPEYQVLAADLACRILEGYRWAGRAGSGKTDPGTVPSS